MTKSQTTLPTNATNTISSDVPKEMGDAVDPSSADGTQSNAPAAADSSNAVASPSANNGSTTYTTDPKRGRKGLKCRNLSNEQRESLVRFLLQHQKDGNDDKKKDIETTNSDSQIIFPIRKLQKGALFKASQKYDVSTKTCKRIWNRFLETVTTPTATSTGTSTDGNDETGTTTQSLQFDVSHRKHQSGRRQTMSASELMDKIRVLPEESRVTVRSCARALGMPHTTIHRRFKSGEITIEHLLNPDSWKPPPPRPPPKKRVVVPKRSVSALKIKVERPAKKLQQASEAAAPKFDPAFDKLLREVFEIENSNENNANKHVVHEVWEALAHEGILTWRSFKRSSLTNLQDLTKCSGNNTERVPIARFYQRQVTGLRQMVQENIDKDFETGSKIETYTQDAIDKYMHNYVEPAPSSAAPSSDAQSSDDPLPGAPSSDAPLPVDPDSKQNSDVNQVEV